MSNYIPLTPDEITLINQRRMIAQVNADALGNEFPVTKASISVALRDIDLLLDRAIDAERTLAMIRETNNILDAMKAQQPAVSYQHVVDDLEMIGRFAGTGQYADWTAQQHSYNLGRIYVLAAKLVHWFNSTEAE